MAKKALFLILLFFALILLLFGCRSSKSSIQDSIQENTGSLRVTINEIEAVSAQLFEPETKMKCYYYEIIGNGPNGETLAEEISDAYYEINHMAAGDWRITIDGFNRDNIHIVTDTKEVTIIPNETAKVYFTPQPVSGEGTVILEVVWYGRDIAEPRINAVLKKDEEIITDISSYFTISGNTASASFLHDTGYFHLELILKDGAEVVKKIPETVRILANQTTEGFIELKLQKLPGASKD